MKEGLKRKRLAVSVNCQEASLTDLMSSKESDAKICSQSSRGRQGEKLRWRMPMHSLIPEDDIEEDRAGLRNSKRIPTSFLSAAMAVTSMVEGKVVVDVRELERIGVGILCELKIYLGASLQD
jgi:hypothetical protein